ncbi:LytR C-terminal domain-containing protein [uncultured Friedmanniella sp.]|uniref:LytR C-terminal domain-containing protein n=1 Tax=uncultured Friedmanniella sp. TaxID=335381 RepID=UPI0035CB2473
MVGRIFRAVRTPFTLLILLAILSYGAWWGWTNVIRTVPPAPPTPCVDQPVSKGQLKSSQVTVSVYNGGDKRGLAGDVGRSLRDRGFKVQQTGNTGEKIQKTVIVGAGAKNPEVLLVKGFFKGAVVRADKRPDRTVEVLVGNDYGGFRKGAKTTYTVKATTVCLPAQATATPSSVTGG